MHWLRERGTALLLLSIVGWSALCLWLAASGLAPSRPPLVGAVLLGPERASQDWYWVQAALIPFVVPVQCWVLVRVCAWFLVRLSAATLARSQFRRGTFASALGRSLAGSLGASLLLGLVLPDALAFGFGGSAGLKSVLPLSGALVLGISWALVTRVVRHSSSLAQVEDEPRLSLPRSAGIAFAGLVMQAAVGAPLLR